MTGDLVVADGRIATTDGLETAVAISLFTDRRARADDVLPDGANGDRRGWWADVYLDEPIGSRLWLLGREKQLASVLTKAREYCEEALGWLVRKKYAQKVVVETFVPRNAVLGIHVEIHRRDGTVWTNSYEYHWRPHAA
ncbi:MAG: phage GP46 family protein [Magnetospirillum sp.]|nr:phage GP46 family protein [Magnetospirillum sp.]